MVNLFSYSDSSYSPKLEKKHGIRDSFNQFSINNFCSVFYYEEDPMIAIKILYFREENSEIIFHLEYAKE